MQQLTTCFAYARLLQPFMDCTHFFFVRLSLRKKRAKNLWRIYREIHAGQKHKNNINIIFSILQPAWNKKIYSFTVWKSHLNIWVADLLMRLLTSYIVTPKIRFMTNNSSLCMGKLLTPAGGLFWMFAKKCKQVKFPSKNGKKLKRLKQNHIVEQIEDDLAPQLRGRSTNDGDENSWPNLIPKRWVCNVYNLWRGHVFTHHPKKVTAWNHQADGLMFQCFTNHRLVGPYLTLHVLAIVPWPSRVDLIFSCWDLMS